MYTLSDLRFSRFYVGKNMTGAGLSAYSFLTGSIASIAAFGTALIGSDPLQHFAITGNPPTDAGSSFQFLR